MDRSAHTIVMMINPLRLLLPTLLTLILGACSTTQYSSRDSAPSRPVDVSGIPDAVPRAEPPSRYGNPSHYSVFGKSYYPMKTSLGFRERGTASWYGTKFHGRSTSSGEPYDMYKMTAAHKTLPLPTYVEVTNVDNGRKVIVKVNDRGPFHGDRVIDLSYAAAAKLGILAKGTGEVEIRALNPQAPETIRSARREDAVASPPSRPLPRTGQPEAVTTTPALFLQLGAFQQRDNAERLQERLQQSAPGQVRISTTQGLSGPVYRVRVGPLASLEEADRLAQTLNDGSLGKPRVVID